MELMVNIAQTSLKGKLAASNEFIFLFFNVRDEFRQQMASAEQQEAARTKEKEKIVACQPRKLGRPINCRVPSIHLLAGLNAYFINKCIRLHTPCVCVCVLTHKTCVTGESCVCCQPSGKKWID